MSPGHPGALHVLILGRRVVELRVADVGAEEDRSARLEILAHLVYRAVEDRSLPVGIASLLPHFVREQRQRRNERDPPPCHVLDRIRRECRLHRDGVREDIGIAGKGVLDADTIRRVAEDRLAGRVRDLHRRPHMLDRHG